MPESGSPLSATPATSDPTDGERPTKLQALILDALAFVPRGDAPPSSWELAESISSGRGILSWERKPTSEAESVARALRRMETKRWVERLGKSISNSWCWAITEPGRVALNRARRG